MKRLKKVTLKDFELHLKQVQQSTTVQPNEPQSEKEKRKKRALKDYRFFFEYYFPHYATSKCSKNHIKLANAVAADPMFAGLLECHRGWAKSVHADIGIALWLKERGEMRCCMLAGQTEAKANALIASVQAELMGNQRYINDFGDQKVSGDWSKGDFTCKDGTAFFSLGLGQSPNGTRKAQFRPQLIICDDLDSRKRAKNSKLVDEAVDWILEDLMGCFDIGFERFLFVNSRISQRGILATLVKKMVKESDTPWWYMKVNALDKNDKSTWPEKYPTAYWHKKRRRMTNRAWNANYMNNPSTEGKIFKREWIRWGKMLKLNQYDELGVYCDPSFTNNAKSDFKAIRFWGKKNTKLDLIDSFVRRCSIRAMVCWFYDLHESLPEDVVVDYFIEANMLQALLLDEFYAEGIIRGYQLPIRGDHRKKPDKLMRIMSTSPLYERGIITYNIDKKNDPDFAEGIEQLVSIEHGSNTNDDAPDADEGIIYIFQGRGRSSEMDIRIGQRQAAGY